MAVSSASFARGFAHPDGTQRQVLQDREVGEKVEMLEDHAHFHARIFSMFLRSLVSSMPSTMILPRWCSSRRLMQRISVDFPNRRDRR
jgi:hypothetical protein